ncbi:MAG: histidine--tRNA ligase [Candidatus Aenigmarchaeota archaeon]|nr:histidine--tRNA ligase [Candidatus Aenigmarchaeota archaeon]
MLTTLPKGMKDIEKEEMAIRSWIIEKIKKVLTTYGFQLVEPSTIENLETLEAQAGEDVKQQIYWFKDKGGKEIGLRFDLTVGITRMLATKLEIQEPIKIACISNMWRYDEPQFARLRIFWQWDAEIYGSKEPEADAEVIVLGIDLMEKFGVKDFEVRIGNRKLTEGILLSIGVEKKQMENVMRIIDKFRKLSIEELKDEFKKYLSEIQIERIMSLIKLSGNVNVLEKIKKILPQNEKAMEGFNELVEVAKVLKNFEKIEKCIFDLSIVRGLGYYTGTVFECYAKGNEDVGAIFAGGRFDNLSKLYGKDRPATGNAGGIERLLILLKRLKLLPKIEQPIKVFVASAGEKVREDVMQAVNLLRRTGISTDFDLKGRSLTRQLEYADSLDIPYVLIIGKKEVESGIVKLRDMKRRTEKEMTLEDLINFFSK